MATVTVRFNEHEKKEKTLKAIEIWRRQTHANEDTKDKIVCQFFQKKVSLIIDVED